MITNPIAGGTTMWFFRPDAILEIYECMVTHSYPQFQEGYSYSIVCQKYPYVIGHAYERELLSHSQAVTQLKDAKHKALLNQIFIFQQQRDDITTKINKLRKQIT